MSSVTTPRKGQSYWNARTDDDGKVVTDEWVCTVVRGSVAYLIRKDRYTWVKRSSRAHGDYGWSKTIHPLDRLRVEVGAVPRFRVKLYRTRATALKACLPELRAMKRRIAAAITRIERM